MSVKPCIVQNGRQSGNDHFLIIDHERNFPFGFVDELMAIWAGYKAGNERS